jgi:hypothetical protein
MYAPCSLTTLALVVMRLSARSCSRPSRRVLVARLKRSLARPGEIHTPAALVQVAVDGGAGHAEDVGDLLDGVLASVVELLWSPAPGWAPLPSSQRAVTQLTFQRLPDKP